MSKQLAIQVKQADESAPVKTESRSIEEDRAENPLNHQLICVPQI